MNRRGTESRRGRASLLGAVALAAVSLAACADGSTEPSPPGMIDVVLTSPNGPEGGLLVEIDGPIRTVETDTGHLFRNDAEGRTQVLIVLDSPGDITFSIGVPNGAALPEYRIIEVSGPDDQLRTDLSAYRLSLGAP